MPKKYSNYLDDPSSKFEKIREVSYQVLMVGTFAGLFWLGIDRSTQTRRPVYESREACLADWNNTPADCEERSESSSSGSSNGYRRVWYGPDVDDSGRAYHADGHTSEGHMRLATSSFRGSSITRSGFGRGFSRGG